MSKFTRKHYQAIAQVIGELQHDLSATDSLEIRVKFCEVFKIDNARFDAGKFINAIKVAFGICARSNRRY